MLFVFGVDHIPANCGFWMKDTPIPLSIAFIDANMKVINVEDMAAEDSDAVTSRRGRAGTRSRRTRAGSPRTASCRERP